MNKKQIPPRSSLKLQARQVFRQQMRPCIAASCLFLALQLLVLYFEMNSGGVLGYYLLNAADYTDTTGIRLVEGGISAVLRFDAAGILFAIPLSFRQLGSFAIVRGIAFVVSVPLLMGVLEHYYAALQNRKRPLSAIFRWYLDLRLTVKAVGLGLVLGIVKWGTRFVGAIPSLALFIWITGSTGLGTAISSVLFFLTGLLFFVGAIASYWIYTLVLPAQYLLIREPDSSVGHILSDGVKVFRGRRWDYLLFRLSFFLWYIIVSVSYGIMGLFVQPYSELSNLLYLQAVTAPEQTDHFPEQA